MFLAGDGQFQRDCSEKTAQQIDEEVKKILDQSYAEAKEILSLHRDQLELVTAELLKAETIDGDTFLQLVGKEPRKKDKPPVDIAPQTVAPGTQAI